MNEMYLDKAKRNVRISDGGQEIDIAFGEVRHGDNGSPMGEHGLIHAVLKGDTWLAGVYAPKTTNLIASDDADEEGGVFHISALEPWKEGDEELVDILCMNLCYLLETTADWEDAKPGW